MLALLQDLWVRIQADLERRAGAAAFDSWLAALRPLALERGTVYLEAPNRMICARVEQLYRPLLEEVLSAAIGTKVIAHLAPAPESVLPTDLDVSPAQPVLDKTNKTAFLALSKLLDRSATAPARLFYFYGAPGVGKSFLLRWWRDQRKKKTRIYDGEKLRDAFSLKIRDRRLDELEAELTTERPLVVDGVHRFGNYERVQREFARVLEVRERQGFVTILTSRHHPRNIWGLDPRLSSVFLSGFVQELSRPGHSARLCYLRALEGPAAQNGRAGVIEKLAREVHGTFGDLHQAWTLEKNDLAHPRHSNYLELIDPSREWKRLRDKVAEYMDIPVDELLGKGQLRRVTLARQVLAWLCVRAGLSQAEVGRFMNGRTRASISYCIKTIEKRMAESEDVRRLVEGLL